LKSLFLGLQIQNVAFNREIEPAKGLLPSGSALDILTGADLPESNGEHFSTCLLPQSCHGIQDATLQGSQAVNPKGSGDIILECRSQTPQPVRPTVMELSLAESTSHQILHLLACGQQLRQQPFKSPQLSQAESANAATATVCKENAQDEGGLDFCCHDALLSIKDSHECSNISAENEDGLGNSRSKVPNASLSRRNHKLYNSEGQIEVISEPRFSWSNTETV
jgi:hypothetical protein